MKILFLECNMGAAGDMLMAALFELLSEEEKKAFLIQMNQLLPGEVKVNAEAAKKCGIAGTHMTVMVHGEEEESIDENMQGHHHTHDAHQHTHNHEHQCRCNSHHTHNHEHQHDSQHKHNHEHQHDNQHNHGQAHHHYQIADIEKVVSELAVSEKVKENVVKIYKLIAEAEANVHASTINEIHFHEVGNKDAIIDITGVCRLIEILNPEKISVSPINTGKGFVRCAHGVLPVPAPATAYLLGGIPSYANKISGELCTPTGAAILKHFADTFGDREAMSIDRTGYGMGKKDFEAANCVRAFLGNTKEELVNDDVAELCCNIDDMSGESMGYAADLLMKKGAKDVFFTSIQMKKNRPGTLFTCICGVEEADMFASLILRHTTTFGVRKTICSRYILERKIEVCSTRYGDIRIKKGSGYGSEKWKAEYDDVVTIAENNNITIEELQNEISVTMKKEK